MPASSTGPSGKSSKSIADVFALCKKRNEELGDDVVTRLFASVDANSDGKLSPAEFDDLLRKLFNVSAIDQQRMGQLWSSTVDTLQRAIDTDESGFIDLAEFKAAWNGWFGQAAHPVHALVVIDVQNDFIDGSLALRQCPAGQDGARVVPVINAMRRSGRFDEVALSLDWHPQEHCSFLETFAAGKCPVRLHPSQDVAAAAAAADAPFSTVTLTAPDGASPMTQVLWPRHCVQGSWGSQLHPGLETGERDFEVHKGTSPHVDSYSAFYDNSKWRQTSLLAELRRRGVTHVFCCGLAYDVCVAFTALHAAEEGFATFVVEDACCGVTDDGITAQKAAMRAAGVSIVQSAEVPSLLSRGSLSQALNAATKVRDARGIVTTIEAAPTPGHGAAAPSATNKGGHDAMAVEVTSELNKMREAHESDMRSLRAATASIRQAGGVPSRLPPEPAVPAPPTPPKRPRAVRDELRFQAGMKPAAGVATATGDAVGGDNADVPASATGLGMSESMARFLKEENRELLQAVVRLQAERDEFRSQAAQLSRELAAVPRTAQASETKAKAEEENKDSKAAKAAAVKEEVLKLLEAARVRGAELRSAAKGTSRSTAVVLTGGPGVGKTTLIDHLKEQQGWPVVGEAALQAIDVLNKALGKEGQKAWRTKHTAAFGDMVGRLAIAQEATAPKPTGGVVLYDRTVLDNLGYSMQRGYPLPDYLTVEVAAQAVSWIDHVLVLDQVASVEDIERRNRETGRKTDPKASVAMSAALEEVYTKLGCRVTRIAKGTSEERGDAALKAFGHARN